MSYEKHTWETGETITAEKLNNLEEGVVSGGGENSEPVKIRIFRDETTGNFYINETFNDIKSAVNAGKMVYFLRDIDPNPEGIIGIVMDYIKLLAVQEGVYAVVLTHFDAGSTPLTFIANSADVPMEQEVEDGANQ